MSEWMKKVRWGNVFVSGLIVTVIMVVLRQVEALITMKYYLNPEYFGLWSKLMMPSAGPPPAAFFVTSFLFTLATACTLGAVFDFMKGSFGKGYWARVIGFTDIMVGLMIVFSYLPMYLMFNVPVGLLVSWLVTSFVSVFVGAMIFAKRLK